MAKFNIKGLGLTPDQWGLDDEAKKDVLDKVADALNQALREAATAVQDQIRVDGPLKGRKLQDAVETALDDHWRDVARKYRKLGADDTYVLEQGADALLKMFKASAKKESVEMDGLLKGLEEGSDAELVRHARKIYQKIDAFRAQIGGRLTAQIVKEEGGEKEFKNMMAACAAMLEDVIGPYLMSKEQ